MNGVLENGFKCCVTCAFWKNGSDFQISVPDLRKGFKRQPLDCSFVRLEFYISDLKSYI